MELLEVSGSLPVDQDNSLAVILTFVELLDFLRLLVFEIVGLKA